MSNVNLQFQAAIPGGPAVTLAQQVAVDAYDVVAATILQTQTVTVPIQPSPNGADVVFLVVSSDHYDAKITYAGSPLGPPPGTLPFKLDGPLVLIGTGAVSFLGTPPPQQLTLANASGSDIKVQVVVGRTIA
jgi:hypothetical protein